MALFLYRLMKMILHKEVKTPASECIGQSLFDCEFQFNCNYFFALNFLMLAFSSDKLK